MATPKQNTKTTATIPKEWEVFHTGTEYICTNTVDDRTFKVTDHADIVKAIAELPA